MEKIADLHTYVAWPTMGTTKDSKLKSFMEWLNLEGIGNKKRILN
jgi:hypothetical protein